MKQPLRPFEDMRAALLAAATPLSAVEEVPTAEALGRVLAVDQLSGLDVPPLDNSSMDGYAVRCADIAAPGTRLRVAQRIPAESENNFFTHSFLSLRFCSADGQVSGGKGASACTVQLVSQA